MRGVRCCFIYFALSYRHTHSLTATALYQAFASIKRNEMNKFRWPKRQSSRTDITDRPVKIIDRSPYRFQLKLFETHHRQKEGSVSQYTFYNRLQRTLRTTRFKPCIPDIIHYNIKIQLKRGNNIPVLPVKFKI
jgi:hypothetical protein